MKRAARLMRNVSLNLWIILCWITGFEAAADIDCLNSVVAINFTIILSTMIVTWNII